MTQSKAYRICSQVFIKDVMPMFLEKIVGQTVTLSQFSRNRKA